MSASKNKLFREFGKALEQDKAALFAGAGLSAGVGYVNWKELLREIAEDLGLEIDLENDLLTIAQFHVNKRNNNRHELDQLIVNEFKNRAKSTQNHQIMAQLNLACVWTTNYDKLLEAAFENAYKVPDVKIRDQHFALTIPRRDVVIYKMHGDVDDPGDAVLTKDDYLAYSSTHSFFLDALRGDLLDKTFLFVGYSFSDPNIEFVLGSLNLALKRQPRTHFCIMRRPQRDSYAGQKKTDEEWAEDFRYDQVRFELRKADLARYGVETVEIDSYDEITEILTELKRLSRLKDVFVSGSAHDYAPLGQGAVESLARRIGKEIIANNCHLISGFGLGIGSAIIVGAMEEVYRQPSRDLNRRLTLRPFPQPSEKQTRDEMFPLWSKIREEMISNAGFCIFLAGNKLQNGQTVPAPGVLGEGGVSGEWELCQKLGKYPIPIGASGHAARVIYDEVMADLDNFYPSIDVRQQFDVLGDETAGEDAWIQAIFAIIAAATKPAKK